MQLSPFRATYPHLHGVEDPLAFFNFIKVNFNSLRKQGFFSSLKYPSIYIHQITRANETHLGLVACVDMEEYHRGNIVPHEKTIQILEEKQISLIKRTKAQLKPVMLTHRKVPGLEALLIQVISAHKHFLEVDFEILGEVHRYWQVPPGPLTNQLLEMYHTQVNTVYVADGHHRLAANSLLFQQHGGPFRWIPASLYAEDQLQVFEFNRIVKGLNGLSPLALLARLSDIAKITPLQGARKPEGQGEITMFLQGECFSLKWRDPVNQPPKIVNQLDVVRLNCQVLEGILGISDIRTDKRVQYLEGVVPLSQLLGKVKKDRVLFCLPPIDFQTFFEISDQRQTLPPKSTWFEPRIRSGILVRELE